MEKFFTEIDKKLKDILDKPIPEFLIKENKNLNVILKNLIKENDKNFAKWDISKKLIKNILLLKGYKTLKTSENNIFDTISEKDSIESKFEIQTDFHCGIKNDKIVLNLKYGNKKGFLLNSEARFIGYLLPKKNIIGFISKEKIMKIIKIQTIAFIQKKINNFSENNDKEKLKKLQQDDFDLIDTYTLIERFEEFLSIWYDENELGYNISVESDNEDINTINLSIPFLDFTKEFRIINI